ncbi:hypothetical protein M513_03157 [Trichuris suis]|uniref:Tyrosine-protein kinase n=1 Tax=Trichuris suis TaxID=68888 RepID=A0A085MFN7_9BILA|nr:hypothetical protein M513_03157 [Trichuris suis]
MDMKRSSLITADCNIHQPTPARDQTQRYDRLIMRQEIKKSRLNAIRLAFKENFPSKAKGEGKVGQLSIDILRNAVKPQIEQKCRSSDTGKQEEQGAPGHTKEQLDKLPLELYNYYHARLSRLDANDILLGAPVGYFLIRASKRTKNTFAIVLSIRTTKSVSHYQIPVDDCGNFFFNEFAFPTVHELLFFHWKQRIPVSFIDECELFLIKSVGRQHWEFEDAEVTLEKNPLGEGNFGAVYRGTITIQGKKMELAVKTLQNPEDENGREELLREARIMRKLKNPGVVYCYGVTISSDATMVLLEYVSGGSMDKYLRTTKVTPYVKLRLAVSAAQGIAHIHKNEILHRDLAARNCLVNIVQNQPQAVKVCDFGLSRDRTKVYRLAKAQHIPVRWSAPEVLHERLWTQKSDVWSFGVLLWEFFTDASLPYFELDPLDGPSLLQYLKEGNRLHTPMDMPPDVAIVMNQMFHFNMDLRPSMAYVAEALQASLEKMKADC